MTLRKGMSIDDVREEMAALEIGMLRLDPNDQADEADVARYLALKASRQHQIDELRYLRRVRHDPHQPLAEAVLTWPEKLRRDISRDGRRIIRRAQRALKTAQDIGPRETSAISGARGHHHCANST